jgi:hypothetical protein
MMNLDLFRRAPKCRTTSPKGHSWTPPPLNLAFQFCARDYAQALRVLEWSSQLRHQDNTIHLITDEGLACDTAIKIASESWGGCHVHRIKKRELQWPASNNYVFVETCKIMKTFSQPWLLWETDMIPARPDWLQRLEGEYKKAQRPFMGAWVDCFDILNGGAIYPPDVISWAPSFFNSPPEKQPAFDCVIAPDIIWFTHPANHMMPNIFYSRPNGRPAGLIPSLTKWTQKMFDWVHGHDTCIIHRDKKGETIPFLREKFAIRE